MGNFKAYMRACEVARRLGSRAMKVSKKHGWSSMESRRAWVHVDRANALSNRIFILETAAIDKRP